MTPNPAGNFPIISVETGGKHIYTLRTDFPEGVELKKYQSKSEPRLKPTLKGEVVKGEQVGEISVRGKKHPVYDKVTAKTYIDPKSKPKTLKATFGVKSKKLGGIIKGVREGSKAKSGYFETNKIFHGSPNKDLQKINLSESKQSENFMPHISATDNPLLAKSFYKRRVRKFARGSNLSSRRKF